MKLIINDCEVLIDKRDAKNLDVSKIYINSDGYLMYGTNRKKKLLHRVIMNPPEGFEIDHRNGNPRDNRRCNLRICTHSQNCMNKPKQKNNKTGYKGISFSKRYGKYVAQIKANKVYHYIGTFDTIKEAAKAYKESVIFYHGEFRNCL